MPGGGGGWFHGVSWGIPARSVPVGWLFLDFPLGRFPSAGFAWTSRSVGSQVRGESMEKMPIHFVTAAGLVGPGPPQLSHFVTAAGLMGPGPPQPSHFVTAEGLMGPGPPQPSHFVTAAGLMGPGPPQPSHKLQER